MTYDKYQEYMRNFFEQYYQKLSQEEICVLTMKYCLILMKTL